MRALHYALSIFSKVSKGVQIGASLASALVPSQGAVCSAEASRSRFRGVGHPGGDPPRWWVRLGVRMVSMAACLPVYGARPTRNLRHGRCLRHSEPTSPGGHGRWPSGRAARMRFGERLESSDSEPGRARRRGMMRMHLHANNKNQKKKILQ
jgi:hypothetical protein